MGRSVDRVGIGIIIGVVEDWWLRRPGAKTRCILGDSTQCLGAYYL